MFQPRTFREEIFCIAMLTKKKPSYSEDDILAAIQDMENGISQRVAAQRWRIPRSTLRHRCKGGVNAHEASECRQRLSKDQEGHIVQWILAQYALGLPLTHQEIKEFAERVVKAGGDDTPLGKGWIENFLRRNPKVRTARGKPLSSQTRGGQPAPTYTDLKLERIDSGEEDNTPAL